MRSSQSYGIVFSGGGALGSWEVGCYDAIRSRHGGSPPIIVTGASAGALNAVGACAGMQPPQLLKLWSDIRPDDVYKPRFTRWDIATILGKAIRVGLIKGITDFLAQHKSVHDTTIFKTTLRNILDGWYNSFAQSGTYFALSVTNLANNRREYFYKVPGGSSIPADTKEVSWERITGLEILLDALVGSTALPILFPPHEQYFDGGVLLNQPITPVMELKEPDILYIVIPTARALGRTHNMVAIGQTVLATWTSASLISQMGRLRLINQRRKDRRREGEPDERLPICVIRPPVDLTTKFGVDLLSFGSNVRELVNDGYTAASGKLDQFNPADPNETTWYDV
jgi:predicted acylesterase/phospholipase RssA